MYCVSRTKKNIHLSNYKLILCLACYYFQIHPIFTTPFLIKVISSLTCCCCSVTSRVWLFETSWTAAHRASLLLTISWTLPKFVSIPLVMPSSHLILWHPLLFLPSILPSIRDFSNESAVHIRWLKYRNFGFSVSPSEYSGLISLKSDWFDLLAVQGTLKSLLQHHSSNASLTWEESNSLLIYLPSSTVIYNKTTVIFKFF